MGVRVSIEVGDAGWGATFHDDDLPAYIISQTAHEARRAAERGTE